ncbi:hypothetical protein ADMFC3_27090 [Geovibrio sp. ADMFC3]|jgi:hypothetical protein|nr:hypothetical protein [Deferribacteraceae bacterium]
MSTSRIITRIVLSDSWYYIKLAGMVEYEGYDCFYEFPFDLHIEQGSDIFLPCIDKYEEDAAKLGKPKYWVQKDGTVVKVYLLHIDGDPEDSITFSSEEHPMVWDDLRKAGWIFGKDYRWLG